MSLKKLASETAIYGLSSIIGRMLFFLLTPLYTNVLKEVFTTEEYGIISHLFSFMAMAMVFFTYRMELAYFRFGTEDKKQEHTSFNSAAISIVISTIFIASLLLLFSKQLAIWFTYPQFSNLVRLAVCIIIVDALSEIPYAKLRLEQRPIRFAVIRLFGTLINLGLNVFFLLFCPYALANESWSFLHPFLHAIYHEEMLLAYVFIANLVGNGISLLLLSPTLFRIRIQDFDPAVWRKMFRYSLPLVVVGISFIMNETFDRFIMLYWIDGTPEYRKEQLGIYSACYKLTMFLTLFTQAFRYGAEPFFFREKNAANAKENYATVAKYFAIFGSIGFLSVLLYLDVLKQYVVGSEYWIGLKVVPILLLANLFLGIYYNLSIWYKLTDQTKWGAYISIAGATITVLMNYFLMPKYGYMAAAWTTFTCYFVMMLLSYGLGRRNYPVPYPVWRIVGYILLAVFIYWISIGLETYVEIGTFIAFVIHTLLLLLYLSVIFFLERKELRGLVKAA